MVTWPLSAQIQETLPALVLSPRAFNELTGRCIACPITRRDRDWSFHVSIPDGDEISGVVQSDQLRSASWEQRGSRFICKAPASVLGGIVLGLAARGRAEHVEMFNAKPLQLGFVLLQSAYGFVAFHKANIANRSLRFHDFRLTSERDASANSFFVVNVQPNTRRIGLFAGLFFSRFSKPNTGATAVFVDEFDAGGFHRFQDLFDCLSAAT
jgi:mRNA interferase MazF